MKNQIKCLKEYYGKHNKVADQIGISRSRYYAWISDNSKIPEYGRKLIQLKVESIKFNVACPFFDAQPVTIPNKVAEEG